MAPRIPGVGIPASDSFDAAGSATAASARFAPLPARIVKLIDFRLQPVSAT